MKKRVRTFEERKRRLKQRALKDVKVAFGKNVKIAGVVWKHTRDKRRTPTVGVVIVDW